LTGNAALGRLLSGFSDIGTPKAESSRSGSSYVQFLMVAFPLARGIANSVIGLYIVLVVELYYYEFSYSFTELPARSGVAR